LLKTKQTCSLRRHLKREMSSLFLIQLNRQMSKTDSLMIYSIHMNGKE